MCHQVHPKTWKQESRIKDPLKSIKLTFFNPFSDDSASSKPLGSARHELHVTDSLRANAFDLLSFA